jgi:hypothetical protein
MNKNKKITIKRMRTKSNKLKKLEDTIERKF